LKYLKCGYSHAKERDGKKMQAVKTQYRKKGSPRVKAREKIKGFIFT